MKRIALFLLMIAWISTAQAANYGKISGQVIDGKTGEPLPGANVTVVSMIDDDDLLGSVEEITATGAATDLDGNYVVLQIPPGNYRVRADYIGYKSVVQEKVQVRADRIAVVNLSLEESVLEGEEVVVIAERPVIERDIAATQRTVSSDDIQNLPSTNVGEVLQAQAGVVNDGGLHFRGGRSGEVTYYMDGVPLTNPLFSEISTSQVINSDAISEMQVISGTYSAEYGNAMSGIVNITTKDGGDRLRGDLSMKASVAQGSHQGDLEWDTASGQFVENSHDYNRKVARASIGGPIIPQKTNFYFSLSYDDRDSYLPFGFRTDQSVFVKLTDKHLKNIKLTASINLTDGERKSYSHRWIKIPDSNFREPQSSSQSIHLGLTHTLNSRMYYNLALYHNRFDSKSGDFGPDDLTSAYQLDENQEFYEAATVTSYGEDDQTTTGLKGDLVWQLNSSNEIKTGFEFRTHKLERFSVSTPYNTNHIRDDYSREPSEFAAYIQDKINFSSIILSAGVRFDMTDPNSDYWETPYDEYYDRDENFKSADVHTQVSPRLGISYPVTDRTVFHFGYGHYFQRPEYQFTYRAMSDEDYDDNVEMNLLSGNGRFGNPNLRPEKTIAYEFGVSHQLMEDYIFNLSVYSKKITKLLGTRTFFPGNPPEVFETYTLHINEDFAYNNGFELQLRKRHGRYIVGEINYTYAVADGSSSGPLERVGSEEANNQTLKFFPLDFDQRHTVNANLIFQLDKNDGPTLGSIKPLENSMLSILFKYGSGLPYTKATRSSTTPYEINNERLPETWTIDLTLEKEFKLASFDLVPFIEIYNLTNRDNILYVDPATGEPDDLLGDGETYEYAANPLNWGDPRLVFVGLNIRY